MNPPAFLLALAPAATAVASRTVAAAKNTGETFASVLGNMLDRPETTNEVETDSKPTLAETVQSVAEKIRTWLSEQGAGDHYSIDFHLTADGESQLDVTGDSANSVKQLLASDSSWLDKLRQLASTIQTKSAQLSRDYSSQSVSIKIDRERANAF